MLWKISRKLSKGSTLGVPNTKIGYSRLQTHSTKRTIKKMKLYSHTIDESSYNNTLFVCMMWNSSSWILKYNNNYSEIQFTYDWIDKIWVQDILPWSSFVYEPLNSVSEFLKYLHTKWICLHIFHLIHESTHVQENWWMQLPHPVQINLHSQAASLFSMEYISWEDCDGTVQPISFANTAIWHLTSHWFDALT